MKAQAARITINGILTLKVLLEPETEEERIFLEKSFDTCVDVSLSFMSDEDEKD
jgi:hypothetical protein